MADKSQIREAQSRLKRGQYYKGEVDGEMSPKFAEALTKFQDATGDLSTGVLTPKTIATLKTKRGELESFPVEDGFQNESTSPAGGVAKPAPANGIGLNVDAAKPGALARPLNQFGLNAQRAAQDDADLAKGQQAIAQAGKNVLNAAAPVPKPPLVPAAARAVNQAAPTEIELKLHKQIEYLGRTHGKWSLRDIVAQAQRDVSGLIDARAKDVTPKHGFNKSFAMSEERNARGEEWKKRFEKHDLPPEWEPVKPPARDQPEDEQRWPGEIEQENLLVKAFGPEMKRKVNQGNLESFDAMKIRRGNVIGHYMKFGEPLVPDISIDAGAAPPSTAPKAGTSPLPATPPTTQNTLPLPDSSSDQFSDLPDIHKQFLQGGKISYA